MKDLVFCDHYSTTYILIGPKVLFSKGIFLFILETCVCQRSKRVTFSLSKTLTSKCASANTRISYTYLSMRRLLAHHDYPTWDLMIDVDGDCEGHCRVLPLKISFVFCRFSLRSTVRMMLILCYDRFENPSPLLS